jgi:penicillin G amidase
MRTRHSCELENEEHVDIVQDVHGVSHVSARSELGLYYGLGYCHGADRALQMLLMRVVAQGRASELLDSSPEMLASDRFFRGLNFAGGTASEVAKLSPADRQLTEAYCKGREPAHSAREKDTNERENGDPWPDLRLRRPHVR